MRVTMLGILTAAGLAACAPMPVDLVPSDWQVTRLDGRELGVDDRVTMQFAEARVAGISGCNRYTGPLVLGEENALSFGILATTRMACPGEAALIEAAFLERMGQIDSYRMERGALVLLAGGAEVMRAGRQ